jgi:hypothetical protein
MRWAGRGAYRILVTRLKGKRPLGKPRLIRKGNIKMDSQVTGLEGMYGINPVEDRDSWRAFVNTVMNPPDFIKCG